MTRFATILLAVLGGACATTPETRSTSVSDTQVPSALPTDELKDLKKRGGELVRAQKWADALPLYTEIVRLEPVNPGAWMRLGECRHFTGDYTGSLDAWTKSAELQENPVARYDIACAHARLGHKDSALEALERAVALGFNDVATMKADVDLESLRGEARYQTALATAAAPPKVSVAPPEARGFDFWVGDWNVTGKNGQQAGTSRVEKILSGFALQENWTSAGGSSGKSWNTYSPSTKRWRQHWVDDAGNVVDYLDGVLEGDHLTVTARGPVTAGKPQLNRMTFFNVDAQHVRQLGESSDDGGTTWKMTFDLLYTRK